YKLVRIQEASALLSQLCAIPEIANSEEMQEFLALNTDARIAFVKKPFVVSRIDKIVVNAIVDTLKTAFPRSEPQSPTEDEVEVDGKVFLDKKSNPSILRVCVSSTVCDLLSIFSHQSVSVHCLRESKDPLGEPSFSASLSTTKPQSWNCRFMRVSVCEMELADVVLNIVCLLVKDQGSYLCTENIQRTIRLLFGTLINRWLAVGVANLTSPRYWVIYLQVIQEAVWPGGALPTQDVEERSQQQKDISKQQALHCLMGLLPGTRTHTFTMYSSTPGPTLRAIRHFYFWLLFCSPSSRMQKLRKDKSKCWVVGCSNPHASLHRLPASEPFQSVWLSFIFYRNVPHLWIRSFLCV
uniref:Sorting nexin C-terminal domain-containing protein n=1 Tax=Gouania willdenowi TaxID=441366 RepID=A0A8C5EAD5_GOUWI